MLGDALHWKPHRFIRAMPGAGKSTLLKYMQALLGSAAHPVQRNFTRARLEQKFSNTACAARRAAAAGGAVVRQKAIGAARLLRASNGRKDSGKRDGREGLSPPHAITSPARAMTDACGLMCNSPPGRRL